MPSFVVIPATPDDLEALIRIQFAACESDPGFSTIFPKGPSIKSVEHFVRQAQNDMENDPTCFFVIVRDVMTRDIASFAIWHFYPPRSQEEIEKEIMIDNVPLPIDANVDAGRRLIAAGVRKRHEVVGRTIGVGAPYAYLSALGTSPKYQKQGAASMLLDWGLERTDDQQLPAYVEGTPIGLGLYLKHGFREVDRLKLETSPWKEGEFYNICMTRAAKTT